MRVGVLPNTIFGFIGENREILDKKNRKTCPWIKARDGKLDSFHNLDNGNIEKG